jgi:hypothetical glycosyl hydrolase
MNYGDWEVVQEGFDQNFLGKTESIMALGNGYMGIRSAEDETYTGETRNTFVAGTFNRFDENEVTELPNVPDFAKTNMTFNGKRFALSKGEVLDYRKALNLKNGELTRTFTWEYEELALKFTFRRFVSKLNYHLYASQIVIENLTDTPVATTITAGLDGQRTNSGSQHFAEGTKGILEDTYLQMTPTTTQSKIDFAFTLTHTLDGADSKRVADIGRRRITRDECFELQARGKVTYEKRVMVYTSIDNDVANHAVKNLGQISIDYLKEIAPVKFDKLLADSAEAWQKIWDTHPIRIDSQNPQDQLAIRFAIYHLHAMTPAHDERMNIGAKGLSGEGYKGHTFWDTEVFMLPYFNFSFPEIAKSLVTYRYLGLRGAHTKAASNGFDGAQYPWEAAWPSDGEVTPVWGAVDIVTGQATKIWSGFIEQHITSDVAFGIKQYMDVTGDLDFAREMGYEILIDTARFWASRLEYKDDGVSAFYEINDVIGPDEYKEHVDNNAYTNYTAHWNMGYAIALIDRLKSDEPEIYAKLDEKFNLSNLTAELSLKLPMVYLPQPTEDGIIPQDDSYLGKQIIDLKKYKDADGVDSLFHDYNLEQVNQMQITKQADVLLLMLLFENLFEKDLKLKNFDYYEPKTTHDSSLSLSTHAILSADLGKLDQSYDFFQKAINIDMGSYMKSSDAGIHAASLGGIWQMIVFGYGGVRMVDGKLRIEPHLPKEWTELEFGFDYQGESLTLKVDKTGMTLVKSDNGNDVHFTSKGAQYTLQNKLTISQ